MLLVSTERTKQREAEFHVAHQHPAAEQAIEQRTLPAGVGHAFVELDAVDVVAAHEPGIADVQR